MDILAKDEYAANCMLYVQGLERKVEILKDDLAIKKRPLKIYHYVRLAVQYIFPVGEVFSSDLEIDYTVFLEDSEWEYALVFEKKRIRVARLSEWERSNSMPDVLFLQHPYYNFPGVNVDFYGIMSELPEFMISERQENQPLLCYVPYAYCVINDEAHPVNGHYNLPLHNIAWRVYCESFWHLQQAQEKSILKGYNWVVSGYPKLNFEKFRCVESSLSLQKDVYDNVILWAPHHNKSFQCIAILEVHQLLQELIINVPNSIVIFRPHPNMLLDHYDYGGLGIDRSKFSEICNFWKNSPNGEFNMSAEINELFSRSTLMLTNSGGFHIEYMVTLKPIVSYLPDWALNAYVSQITSEANYSANNITDLSRLLNLVAISKTDLKLQRRIEWCRKIEVEQQPAQVILSNIKSELLPIRL